MTIQDKSTAIGGGADLAQDIIDSVLSIDEVKSPDGTTFLCYQVKTGGNIYVPADDNQRGSSSYYRFDSAKVAAGSTHASQTIIDACAAFDGTQTRAAVETQLKAFLNEAEYVENPEAVTRVAL